MSGRIDEVDTEGMSVDEKVDVLIEAVVDISDTLEEILEGIRNLSTPGGDFTVERYDS